MQAVIRAVCITGLEENMGKVKGEGEELENIVQCLSQT
jgi:hypothetical protein